MEPLLTFLTTPFLGKAAWLWLAFLGIVALLLVVDLGLLHRGDLKIGVRESLLLSAGVAYSLLSARQPAPAAGG